ncbi:MAG: hypothetical protein HYX75_03665 [Acidobacteria bacterium]|nr:hypothetical protein [Acidobacteriota bacterium]
MRCTECESLFPVALYEEIGGEELQHFQEHLAGCLKCSADYAELLAVRRTMDERRRTEPPEAFWDQYWEQLAGRLESAERASVSSMPHPRWSSWLFRSAAAASLMAAGIVVGLYYARHQPIPTAATTSEQQPVAPAPTPRAASSDDRTMDYLRRSEVLLLGIVNHGASETASIGIELAREKKVSRDLVAEAAVLKHDLASPEQRRLRQLVSDLEIILLQIANLETQQDLPQIELVRSGVDRTGILLKINVEQMRMADRKDAPSGQESQPL